MDLLTGLEWSTGCFGLAIGLTVGAVITWFCVPRVAETVERPLAEDITISRERPPEPDTKPIDAIAIRALERFAEACDDGDDAAKLRQISRLAARGIHPPHNAHEARVIAQHMQENNQ